MLQIKCTCKYRRYMSRL